MSLRIVGFTIGILLGILGVALLVPAAVDLNVEHENAGVFIYSAAICYFFGGLLYLSCRGAAQKIDIRQGFVLTTLSWFVMCGFSALPLYFSNLDISFTDAFFESVSGITTTGSTVLVGLDTMSPGILIWRSMMQWIGGMGLIGFAIVMLPFLRVGGMQLFRTESSDRYEKVMPKTADIINSLLKVYCGLTVLCAGTYYALGMSVFDAVNHAMTTIPTGGYSTHDSSFGFFKSFPLDMAAVIFMMLGGLPFVLYIKLVFRHSFEFHRDAQVRAFLLFFVCVVAVFSLWLWEHSDYSLLNSFRYVAFNVISVITTCGYASTDYLLWGPFAGTLFFFLTYIGACAGSTSGGIKMIRVLVASAAMGKEFKSTLYPHGIFKVKYEGKPVSGHVIKGVLTFLCLYVAANVLLTVALTITGLDFVTAVSGAATALGNVGPGLGATIGPAGNFSTLPDTAKWLLCAGMLLGRLEIMTVMVILTPGFWKR